MDLLFTAHNKRQISSGEKQKDNKFPDICDPEASGFSSVVSSKEQCKCEAGGNLQPDFGQILLRTKEAPI